MLLLRAIGDRWPRAALLLGAPGTVGRVNQGLLRKLGRDAFVHSEPARDAENGKREALFELLLELSLAVPDSPDQPQAPATRERLRSLVAELARIIEEIPEVDPETGGPEVIDAGEWERGRWLMRTTATVGKSQERLLFFLIPFRPRGFEGPSAQLPEGSITARPICADGRMITTNLPKSADGTPIHLAGLSGWLTSRRLDPVLDFIADDEALRVSASIAALDARLEGRSPTAAYNGLLAGRFKFPQETSAEIHRRMRLISRALRSASDREELAFLAPAGIDLDRITNKVLSREPDLMAEAHYVQGGWSIVARNVFNGRGKVDFIARKGDDFVACEVKSWTAQGTDEGESTLSPSQLWERLGPNARASMENVRKAAFDWAIKNDVSEECIRFDVALIIHDSVVRVPDAF